MGQYRFYICVSGRNFFSSLWVNKAVALNPEICYRAVYRRSLRVGGAATLKRVTCAPVAREGGRGVKLPGGVMAF